jgi:hypothetical protein
MNPLFFKKLFITLVTAGLLLIPLTVAALSSEAKAEDSSQRVFDFDACPQPISPILNNPNIVSIAIYEQTTDEATGGVVPVVFQRGEARIREDIAQSPTLNDWNTGSAEEYYDAFVSDARGNVDPNGSYVTIDDLRTRFYENDAVGNNIDAVELRFADGSSRFAEIVTHVELGTGLSGDYVSNFGYALRSLGAPNGQTTRIGDQNSSFTVGWCDQPTPTPTPTATPTSTPVPTLVPTPTPGGNTQIQNNNQTNNQTQNVAVNVPQQPQVIGVSTSPATTLPKTGLPLAALALLGLLPAGVGFKKLSQKDGSGEDMTANFIWEERELKK